MIPFLGATALNAQSTDASDSPLIEQKGEQHRHQKKALANLTEAERQQLKSAMQKIKADPQFVAARQSVKDAQTKEALTEARKSVQQIRRDLLLKADPSLATILGKINPEKPIQ